VSEVTLGGATYRVGQLNARKQWNVTKRLLKPLAEIGKIGANKTPPKTVSEAEPETAPETTPQDFFDQVSGPLADAISSISDADSDYIIDTCLAVCDRQQGTTEVKIWAPLMRGGNLMFQDLDMPTMLGLTIAVLKENLQGFFSSDQPASSASAAAQK
jgi:hypothetical protein